MSKLLADLGYKSFVAAILQAAEKDELPIAFQLDDVENITLDEIERFCKNLEKDTGLDISGHFFICPDCESLHIIFEANYFEDDNTLLQ